jgi:hypothetical protein
MDCRMPQLESRWTSWLRVFRYSAPVKEKPAKEDGGLSAWCTEASYDLALPELARKVRVVWNPRMQTTAGRAWWPDRTIELNPKLRDCEPEELWRTLKHELAHLIAYERCGRRHIFRNHQMLFRCTHRGSSAKTLHDDKELLANLRGICGPDKLTSLVQLRKKTNGAK